MAVISRCQPRWILTKDISDLVSIEEQCFEMPWASKDFHQLLQKKHVNGLVIDKGRQVVAYLIFEVCRKRASIINLAVHPEQRRQGLASSLIKALLQQLGTTPCGRVTATVRETGLPVQLFLKTVLFRAKVLRQHYDDTGEDAYEFEYWLRRQQPAQVGLAS